uniref:LON peptidase N-terminal domain and RING finger protein 1-like n=1 Tax=Styela clava TaxID=7725 RepID=UPI00193A2D2E|nr:LON peptidase N-terminal domain and RING finger protein 1-like [Styela clava]
MGEVYVMKRLISRLVEQLRQDAQDIDVSVYPAERLCSGCQEFLYHPVTSPCGHSFCDECSKGSVMCIHCKHQLTLSQLRVNVTLNYVLEMLFPDDYLYFQLISEGDKLLQNSLHDEALSKYNEAISHIPGKNLAVLKRAIAYNKEGHWKRALSDVVSVILRGKYASKSKEMPTQELLFHEEEIIEKIVQAFTEEISHKNFSHQCSSSTSQKWTYPIATYSENSSSIQSHDELCSTEDQISEDPILMDLQRFLELVIAANLPLLTRSHSASYCHFNDSTQNEVLEIAESDTFNCILCSRLLYDPVCTSCGHSFCRDCLDRWFDHRLTCPMCQSKEVRAIQKDSNKCYSLATDITMNILMQKCIPNLVKERELYREEERKVIRETVPIFVCTLALPYVRCLLHVHEPRYRLMMRRVEEFHNGNFGMATASTIAPFSKYGTILNVEKMSILPDGRSNLVTMGTRRFEVVQYDKCDGYHTAKLNYIVDVADADEKSKQTTTNMAEEVYLRAKECFQRCSFRFKTITEMQIGKFPEQDKTEGDDGPLWAWWVLAMIPSNDNLKLHVLKKTRFRHRLALLNSMLKKFDKMSSVRDLMLDE